MLPSKRFPGIVARAHSWLLLSLILLKLPHIFQSGFYSVHLINEKIGIKSRLRHPTYKQMPLLRWGYQSKGFSQSFLIHLISRLVFQPEFLIYLTSGSFCIWGSWNCTCVDHETGIPLSTLGITLTYFIRKLTKTRGQFWRKTEMVTTRGEDQAYSLTLRCHWRRIGKARSVSCPNTLKVGFQWYCTICLLLRLSPWQ